MAYLKYDGTPASVTSPPTADFYGQAGAETMSGTAAAESFWGADGDRMQGGAGDDTYWLQALHHRLEVVEQADGGVDRLAGWQNLSLENFAHIENLFVGLDGIYGAGNGLDNVIEGGDGAQQLYGGGGQDVLVGGPGADVFIVVKGEGNDVIQDFSPAQDVVRLRAGFTSFAEVQARLSQVGGDVKLDLGGGEGLMFRNLTVGQLTAANFKLGLDLTGFTQTFADDFDGLSLRDPESAPAGTWRTEYGYQGTQGVGSYTLVSNDEKQIYTSPYFRDHAGDFAETPFAVNGDGTVSIWARPSSNPEIFGYGYTSGLLSTQASFSQTYGYFEMRADLPDAAGAWPAFWLLPVDGSWPPELDVMEALTSDPNAAWTTKHSGLGGHTSEGRQHYVPETADGFHTYGALWTATEIVWYIDGAEVFRAATPADMHKPMFMIANLALGGWGGTIDDGDLPAEMRIDYIRAYQLPAPPSGGGGGSSGGAGSGGGSVGGGVPVDPDRALVAKAGGDSLQGGSGNDLLTGGSGKDILRGGSGMDRLSGGEAFDDLHGNAGDDTVSGGAGDDWVVGGKDADLLSGDDGDDIVYGNIGDDWCDGGEGADLIRGGQGDDRLFGQGGNDWLSGDRGDDTVTGGAGADVFHSFTGAGLDRVTDFRFAEGDRVQLDPGTAYSVAQVGADVVVTMGPGDQLVLEGVQLASLGDGWIFGA
ncbi:family 16 glycosylhydrolase [Phenylobacterium sp.]|uniref:family 16 glycosylhydrolase n=1 Tax=Phenylobacterium sp. TaxID=1871053 RepID=UPI002FE169E2